MYAIRSYYDYIGKNHGRITQIDSLEIVLSEFISDGAGTKANLKEAIQNVATVMDTTEQLFIYITDHGDRHNIIEELEKVIA